MLHYHENFLVFQKYVEIAIVAIVYEKYIIDKFVHAWIVCYFTKKKEALFKNVVRKKILPNKWI